MKKPILLFPLFILFISCDKENDSPLNSNVYYNVWETDSIAFKEYKNDYHIKTTNVKKKDGYFKYIFNSVNHDDLGTCTSETNINKPVLRIRYIDSNSEEVNYDEGCFKSYIKYVDAIYIGSKSILDKNNFDWGSIESKDQQRIISQNNGYAIVKSIELDYPEVGTTTETYYYFQKNR